MRLVEQSGNSPPWQRRTEPRTSHEGRRFQAIVGGRSAAPSAIDVIRGEVEAFLAAHRTVSLATVDEAGAPHAASLLYACDGLGLFWTSHPGARHSRHLGQRPRVAATIAPDYPDYRGIRGVQIHGTARLLRERDEIQRARDAMRARYPFLARLAEGPLALQSAWARACFYRLDPLRLVWIDNTRGLGSKAILEFRPDGSVEVIEA